MCRSLDTIQTRLAPAKAFSNRFLVPVVQLALRLIVAKAFFVSGWLKLGYVLNDQLDTLYFLIEDYKVPFLPVKIAAWMGMAGELGLSTLLALGLCARFGAVGLIVMCGVIYNTDGNPLALYWALICAAVAVSGAGRLSLDAMIWRNRIDISYSGFKK